MAGATSLYSDEQEVVSIVGIVSVCEMLEADNGSWPYFLKIDVSSPDDADGRNMPYLFFKDLKDLKVHDGIISTADVVSLDIPKKFVAPRKVGAPFRRVCLDNVKNLKLVTKCPPENQPASVFQGRAKQAPEATSQSDSSSNSRSGPLPPPPGWPTGPKPKEAPGTQNTDASEAKPVVF